jgi:hypothetical protein
MIPKQSAFYEKISLCDQHCVSCMDLVQSQFPLLLNAVATLTDCAQLDCMKKDIEQLRASGTTILTQWDSLQHEYNHADSLTWDHYVKILRELDCLIKTVDMLSIILHRLSFHFFSAKKKTPSIRNCLIEVAKLKKDLMSLQDENPLNGGHVFQPSMNLFGPNVSSMHRRAERGAERSPPLQFRSSDPVRSLLGHQLHPFDMQRHPFGYYTDLEDDDG